jgi:hypothetical protein
MPDAKGKGGRGGWKLVEVRTLLTYYAVQPWVGLHLGVTARIVEPYNNIYLFAVRVVDPEVRESCSMVGEGQTDTFGLDDIFAFLVRRPQRCQHGEGVPTRPNGLDRCKEGCSNREELHCVLLTTLSSYDYADSSQAQSVMKTP